MLYYRGVGLPDGLVLGTDYVNVCWYVRARGSTLGSEDDPKLTETSLAHAHRYAPPHRGWNRYAPSQWYSLVYVLYFGFIPLCLYVVSCDGTEACCDVLGMIHAQHSRNVLQIRPSNKAYKKAGYDLTTEKSSTMVSSAQTSIMSDD